MKVVELKVDTLGSEDGYAICVGQDFVICNLFVGPYWVESTRWPNIEAARNYVQSAMHLDRSEQMAAIIPPPDEGDVVDGADDEDQDDNEANDDQDNDDLIEHHSP